MLKKKKVKKKIKKSKTKKRKEKVVFKKSIGQNTYKSSSFITTIPETGDLEGFVIASCGMCNFGYKAIKGCSLSIKIGDTVYPVEGTSIHDHGDAHSEEGFCSAIRVAYVSGKVKKNKFYSESFSLIESPK